MSQTWFPSGPRCPYPTAARGGRGRHKHAWSPEQCLKVPIQAPFTEADLLPLPLAEEPLLARRSEGRAFQGLRGTLKGNLLWTEAFPPQKTQLSPPGAAAPLPRGSLALPRPVCWVGGAPGSPRTSPSSLGPPGIDGRGAGPGRGPAPFIPRRRAPPRAEDSAGGSGAPRVPTREARYCCGRRSPARGHRAGRVLMSTLLSVAGLWAALVARPAPGRRPSRRRARDSRPVICPSQDAALSLDRSPRGVSVGPAGAAGGPRHPMSFRRHGPQGPAGEGPGGGPKRG